MAQREGNTSQRRIAIIGAPLCDGERELGVEKAPKAIRQAGLLAALRAATFRDLGDIPFETPIQDIVSGRVRNTEHVVNGCRRVREVVAGAARERDFPLVIGGDCSLFPGSLAGILDAYERVGVLYVDGHADFHNPETTISGYYSGMGLAAAVGRGEGQLVRIGKNYPLVRGEDVSAVGVKTSNFDDSELRDLKTSRVNLVTAEGLKKDGVLAGLRETTRALPRPLYLHFDLDVLNVTEMPALAGIRAGVHHSGGLSRVDVVSLCQGLAGLPLIGMDITLYEPNLDPDRTYAELIIDLIRKMLPDAFR